MQTNDDIARGMALHSLYAGEISFYFLFCLVCEYTVMLFFSYGKKFISETSNCLRSPAPPGRPLAEKNVPKASTLTISKGVFNFNVLALVVSEILGESKSN